MPALADPKYEAFARYVAAGQSKREAAIAAGYAAKDASSRGSKLARRPEISQRIGELQQTAAELALEGAQISRERVLREYGKLAFLDIRKAFNKDGNLLPLHEIDDDTAAAIAGLEVEHTWEKGEVEEEREPQPHGGELTRKRQRVMVGNLAKIKLSDKKGALDSLARHRGMFVDRKEITGKDGGPIQVTISPDEEKL
jgi:phage terminase small subunit